MKVKSTADQRRNKRQILSGTSQSRRRILTFIVLLIVVVGAFIILRPRLWVKNKSAKVIVDGRLSEDVKLFHGSNDRLLFYLRSEPAHAYYFSAHAGVLLCESSDFVSMKIIVFSPRATPRCSVAAPTPVIAQQSLEFAQSGHTITVSWQPAPR
jgi:hypothetical protein